ncbi:MAG: ATP synthase F1 subunit gamma [Patescibacteria group bacterium]|jgi:F-type H+-transporting ATPase subunit gamma|nr:ATP synthase F1 subunit gamma [Patescibacteria group bacterium]
MTNSKEIKKRIKSITNTKKITKAMEMVAAAKMRRSIDAVLKTRTYANLAWETLINIATSLKKQGSLNHPLIEKRDKTNKELIVLISSNRGLCGGFNSAIINKAIKSIKLHSKNSEFILIGKRGESVGRRYGYNIVAQYEKPDTNPKVADIQAIAKEIIDDYVAKKYDKIFLAYTDFASTAKQVPRIRQILPVDIEAEDKYLGATGKSEKIKIDKEYIKEKEGKHLLEGQLFKYEPDENEVLNSILPRLIEVQLFQGLLESNASEHSARMAAMHQATSAANDLVDELTLYYNKARQAAITSEIAEISAGAAILNS